MDPSVRTLCEARGFVTRPELLAMGYDDSAIRRWVTSSGGVRVRRGVYTWSDLWEGLEPAEAFLARSRAVQMQADAEAALSHVSALVAFDLAGWDLPFDRVHLTRFDSRGGRREAGVVQHRGVLRADDVSRRHGVWVTSATRTALDLTTVLDVDHSVVNLDALLHADETTVQALRARYDAMTYWPGTLSTDLVLRLVDPLSESPGESLTRLLCWRESLPSPVSQYEVRDGDRLVARLDLAWPEHKLWLEFDGRVKYEKHRRPGESVSDLVLREKRREDEVRQLTGWRCIRISWHDLANPRRVAAMIRRAMTSHAA